MSYRLENSLNEVNDKSRAEIRKAELYSVILQHDHDSIGGSYPTTIDELKEVRERIRSKGEARMLRVEEGFKHIREADEKAHLLLKSNIFKSIPADFYIKHRDSLFAGVVRRSPEPEGVVPSSGQKQAPIAFVGGKMKTDLGAPASRNDAIALLRWLNSILEKLSSAEGNMGEDDKFELAQTVYYISFTEIIRQVSVQCVERGLLIWKIWQAYLSLVEHLSSHYKEKMRKLQQKHEERLDQTHTYYEKEINECRTDAENAKKRLDEKITENAALRDTMQKVEERSKEMDELLERERQKVMLAMQQNDTLQETYKKCAEKNNRLKDELNEMRQSEEYFRGKSLDMIREQKSKMKQDEMEKAARAKESGEPLFAETEAQTGSMETVEVATDPLVQFEVDPGGNMMGLDVRDVVELSLGKKAAAVAGSVGASGSGSARAKPKGKKGKSKSKPANSAAKKPSKPEPDPTLPARPVVVLVPQTLEPISVPEAQTPAQDETEKEPVGEEDTPEAAVVEADIENHVPENEGADKELSSPSVQPEPEPQKMVRPPVQVAPIRMPPGENIPSALPAVTNMNPTIGNVGAKKPPAGQTPKRAGPTLRIVTKPVAEPVSAKSQAATVAESEQKSKPQPETKAKVVSQPQPAQQKQPESETKKAATIPPVREEANRPDALEKKEVVQTEEEPEAAETKEPEPAAPEEQKAEAEREGKVADTPPKAIVMPVPVSVPAPGQKPQHEEEEKVKSKPKPKEKSRQTAKKLSSRIEGLGELLAAGPDDAEPSSSDQPQPEVTTPPEKKGAQLQSQPQKIKVPTHPESMTYRTPEPRRMVPAAESSSQRPEGAKRASLSPAPSLANRQAGSGNAEESAAAFFPAPLSIEKEQELDKIREELRVVPISALYIIVDKRQREAEGEAAAAD